MEEDVCGTISYNPLKPLVIGADGSQVIFSQDLYDLSHILCSESAGSLLVEGAAYSG